MPAGQIYQLPYYVRFKAHNEKKNVGLGVPSGEWLYFTSYICADLILLSFCLLSIQMSKSM